MSYSCTLRVHWKGIENFLTMYSLDTWWAHARNFINVTIMDKLSTWWAHCVNRNNFLTCELSMCLWGTQATIILYVSCHVSSRHIRTTFWLHTGHIGCSHSLLPHNGAPVLPSLPLCSQLICPSCAPTELMNNHIWETYTMVTSNVSTRIHREEILY